MKLPIRSRSLGARLIGPLVALLLVFVAGFFYLSVRFQSEYAELNRQLEINSEIGKSTSEVVRTRGRVREVLLLYRMRRTPAYLQELATLSQQLEKHLERIISFGDREPSWRHMSRSLVSGLRASDFLRIEMIMAVRAGKLEVADQAFDSLSTLYEINTSRMRDYSLFLESEVYRIQFQLRRLLVQTFWLAVLAISVVAFSIWLISAFYRRNVLSPLKALHTGLKQLSQGDLKIQVKPGAAPDEIREMTIDFNKMASALNSTHQELVGAIRARDEFLSIASHELKTPLTSLKLQAQLHLRAIQKKDPKALSEERVGALAHQTEKQVSRLTRLVDDMLDVSRIQFGKLTLKKERFELSALVAEVLAGMKDQFAAAGCAIPQLEAAEDCAGSWDKLRLEQVVTNLLTNAIRYGKGKPVEVKVSARPGWVELSVKDQGIGIDPANKKVIFDRFERAVNSNEVSGMGLGLFITRQIVVAHHGQVYVESELGKGSVFIVELPR